MSLLDREIKIRYYLTYKDKVVIKKYFYIEHIEDMTFNTKFFKDFEIHKDNYKDVKLHRCQYTGLLDKNDDEIYNHDIIKDSSGRLMIVEWDNRIGTARFIFRVINTIGHIKTGRLVNTHDWITSDENDIEVIGNIYENPELLENKK